MYVKKSWKYAQLTRARLQLIGQQIVTVAAGSWGHWLLFGGAGDKLGHLAEHPL